MGQEPETPRSRDFREYIQSLNDKYGLNIPNAAHINFSFALKQQSGTRWQVLRWARILFWDNRQVLYDVVANFDEWVEGNEWSSSEEQRLQYLLKLMSDELWIRREGPKREPLESPEGRSRVESPKKRRLPDKTEDDENEEGFRTAPTSPMGKRSTDQLAGFDPSLDVGFDFRPEELTDTEFPKPERARDVFRKLAGAKEQTQYNSSSSMNLTISSTVIQPLNRSDESIFGGSPPHPTPCNLNTSSHNVDSFATNTSSIFDGNNAPGHSFMTDMTDPETQESIYAESVFEQLFQDGLGDSTLVSDPSEIVRKQVLDQLLEDGPFSVEQSLPRSISLRCRYEVERIGRQWGVPLRDILRGDAGPNMEYDAFWKWVRDHSMRGGRPLPEKPSRKAWEAAIGSFKTDKHSEVVVMTGILDWTSESDKKPGLFDLTLNPLKTERTCRFHRRFGSDRFLSLLMPPPSKPPPHLGVPSSPALLRECISSWLTRNEHQCLGRTWRSFYLEDVQRKGKEALLRVHLFAVDGVDFVPPSPQTQLGGISAANQDSSCRTKMTIDQLIDWHIPRSFNSGQSNCKLFQRLALGLSKTYASVKLDCFQIVHPPGPPKNKHVMNDGCALMSRALANKIYQSLGISGNTPSAFQGRIAGAKGLWMVDRHESIYKSFIEENGPDIWIEISDSQLKIHPHPREWEDDYDPEKLTFEVCKWSKPLHAVDLNIQLLSILDHGGNPKLREYLAELTRDGINQLAQDFEDVLKSDSSVLCRSLLQKFKPTGESAYRQLDQWALKDTEYIIRLAEAGFSPRNFFPLRNKLQEHFAWIIKRRIEDVRIEVPLSTYAFCIADPYNILEPDEVYFGFSTAWRGDEKFQSSFVQGDVLVGRTPAHLPSDIQRRRAVFKIELHHFMDVIVFSSKSEIPLAHMLSGGDYDGDAPWICWDPEIVNNFENSDMPKELDLKADHFRLTNHSRSMVDMKSTEDFLQSTFEFNLTLSNLGRCTREHEKIQYEESLSHPSALEVGALLGHLVDSRKAGVLLTEEAWKTILKRVSPKERSWPAYIPDPEKARSKPKKRNIVDYLKFWVAQEQSNIVRTRIEQKYSVTELSTSVDEDLMRPWESAKRAVETDQTCSLEEVLNTAKQSILDAKAKWTRLEQEINRAQQAADFVSQIAAPESSRRNLHPLVHTWQNSSYEWQRLLASCAYRHLHVTGHRFLWYAYGDTLCDMKASMFQSRMIINPITAIYRVNPKAVARLTPGELVGDETGDADEFEGGEELESIEAMPLDNFGRLEERPPIE